MSIAVSVIIPSYNNSKFLKQAVDSVLMQRAPRVMGVPFDEENPDWLEVIVVNDNSPADEDAVMAEYAEDERVLYIKNGENLGVAESRNVGVSASSGEYVAFLDADDFWEQGKLMAQLELLWELEGFDEFPPMICAGRQLCDENGEPTGKEIGVPDIITYDMLLKTNYIPCGTVLMPKEIALEFPMTNDDLHEDYICWLNITKEYGPAVGINIPYLNCRLSEGGRSRNKLKSAGMQYGVYKHMGIGPVKRLLYMASYTVNGFKKYK
ncbi:MAG: glycosyltransferase [Lachnospiraceae bacterium]|nr:glycosyltransferase [Lachnospiraceae bacterium]